MSSNQQQTLTPNGNISEASASSCTSTAGAAKQPPTWFDLSEIDPNQALIDIRHFTHNFEGMHDVDFRERFDNSINRHFGRVNKPVIIGYIPAPPKTNANNIDVVKKIIGQNGYWLKKTTENCGVHFIWYDSTLNNFLFWAPNRFTISKAMNAIRWRLIKYYEFTFTRTTPLNADAIYYHDGIGDGFDELPPLIPCNELTPPPRPVLTSPPPIKNPRRWETYGRKFSDYKPEDDTPNSLEEDENYDNYGQKRIQTGSVPLARRLCVSPSPPPIPPPPPPSSSRRRS